MPITVPGSMFAEDLPYYRAVLNAAETVNDLCVDFLRHTSDGDVIDQEALANERVTHVVNALKELDEIVSDLWGRSIYDQFGLNDRLAHDTIERARALALAIREALAVVSRVEPPQPSPSVTPDPAVHVTPRQAIIRYSVLSGEPWEERLVDVVSIDGDTLTYKIDAFWTGTAVRSAYQDWSLVELPAPGEDEPQIEVGR